MLRPVNPVRIDLDADRAPAEVTATMRSEARCGRIILDVASSWRPDSPETVRQLACCLSEACPEQGCRCAVLVHGPSQYGAARMLSGLVARSKIEIGVFTDAEQAKKWLR